MLFELLSVAIVTVVVAPLHLWHRAAAREAQRRIDSLARLVSEGQQRVEEDMRKYRKKNDEELLSITIDLKARRAIVEGRMGVVLKSLAQVQEEHRSFQADKAQIMMDLVDQKRTLQQCMVRLKEMRRKQKEQGRGSPEKTGEQQHTKSCKCLQMDKLGQQCSYCKHIESREELYVPLSSAREGAESVGLDVSEHMLESLLLWRSRVAQEPPFGSGSDDQKEGLVSLLSTPQLLN
ncbi:hypothetical protein FOL47_000074 [Perkinsus chesapeaki]|uniref:Uncharacterized protein n=1 Tax=Perkinsus chesapeaki TaxID=330153 RepID=A0A7J6N3B0_PERCH|nr:hypothetical protein FOL47_000074 [Perkinsus chesapeaki]